MPKIWGELFFDSQMRIDRRGNVGELVIQHADHNCREACGNGADRSQGLVGNQEIHTASYTYTDAGEL